MASVLGRRRTLQRGRRGVHQLMPGRGLMAAGALCSLTVAVSVADVTRADQGRSPSGAGFAAVTTTSPLSVGPVTSLPAPPVAVARGEPTRSGKAALWVLGRQAIWEVAMARSGTGSVMRTTPLPPNADAVAIACRSLHPGVRGLGIEGLERCGGETLAFVLDRASEAVLMFERKPDGRLTQKASLAVGSRPSAFVFTNFNEELEPVRPLAALRQPRSDELTDVAVVNEGSDDVSVLLAREDGTYASHQRIAVGARPRDIVAGDFDGRGGHDLAVANAGAGSISFLGGDETGTFARRADVVVGGTPTTLLTDGPDGWIDLNDDRVQDLVVADATQGTISVLLGHRDPTPPPGATATPTPVPGASAALTRLQTPTTQDAAQSELPRLASRISLPGGAASEPVAMRLVDRLGDERTHLLVAARGTGEVFDIPISDSGALGAPSRVMSGARPVAVHGDYFLTADLAADVVVADDSGALRLLVASPSRMVDQRPGAANVTAGDGLVVWSQHVGRQRYRLRIADRSGVRYLPASTSRRRLVPRLGRAADGTPLVTYRRCRVRGCTPWVWSAAGDRARRLHVPTARGCIATDAAMWRGALAFLSAAGETGQCARGQRGLWVSARARRHRISGRAIRLGDLRGQRVSWFEGTEVFGRLRISTLHGRPRTVVGWTADDGSAFELGLLSGPFVYWLEPPDRGQNNATLKRASVSARASSCRFLSPEESLDSDGNHWLGRRAVAIDGAEVVYLVHRYGVFAPGVFATAPNPTRWQPCR